MRKVKGLSKEKNRKNHGPNNSMVITRGKWGWGQVKEGKGEINGDGRRLDLGSPLTPFSLVPLQFNTMSS